MARVETPWIVPEDQRRKAADKYAFGHAKWAPIEGVILHYTASKSFRATTKYLAKDDDAYASAHFNIARDGELAQLVSLDDRAWHAGGRTSKFLGRGNVNGRTIGIEMMNLGWLKIRNGLLFDAYGKPFVFGPIYENPMAEPHAHWEAYPGKQLETLTLLLRTLATTFPVLRDDPAKRVVGHQHVDPTRKTDPGPAFPWIYVMRRAFGEHVYKI